MMNQIAQLKPNSKAKLTLVRQSNEMQLDIVVGKRPPFKPED